MSLRLLPLLLLTLAACDGGDKDTDTSGPGPDDTGDTGTPSYDPGCITVDGGGGYAHLQDAVTVAQPGATILLCDGTYAESVVVDKAVTIEGASVDGARIEGQGTSPAVTIAAADVTLKNLTVTATYSGVVVDGVGGALIEGVTFDAPAYWGLQLKDTPDATVRGSTFSAPGGGAVEVSGGVATLEGLSIDSATGFGVSVVGGADVTLTGSTITSTIMTTDDVSDGYALNVVESALTTDGNTILVADGMGLWGDTSDITLRNDTITGAVYLGIFAFDGVLDVEGVTITDAALNGAYLVAPTVRWVDNVVSASPMVSCSTNYERWDPNSPWCGGALLVSDALTVEGGDISGYNNYGLYVGGYTDVDMPATITGLTIHDVGRWGLRVDAMDATVSGLTITGMYEPEMAQPCRDDTYIYLDRSVSLVVSGGDLTLTDSDISGNDAWGVSIIQANVTASGTTFTGNACSSVLNYQGAATLTGNTFSGGVTDGQVWNYEAATILDSNLFTDNHAWYSYTYNDGVNDIEIRYSGYGLDVQSYSGALLQVTNNTFTDGDQGISVYYGVAEITGNTWSGYDGYGGALVYAYDPDDAVVIADNTADDFGGYFAFTYYGDLEVEDTVIGTHRASEIQYEQYTNGKLSYTSSWQSVSPLFYTYGSTSGAASLQVDGLEAGDLVYGLATIYDSDVTLKDVRVGSAGTTYSASLVTGTWSYVTPVVEVDGLSAGTVGGSGVALTNDVAGATYLTLAGLSFESVMGTAAVSVDGFDGWSLTGADILDAGTYGIYAVTASTSTQPVVIDDVSVSSASSYGMYFSAGSPAITNSAANGSGSGLYLSGTSASVEANAFTTNTSYGMVCASTTLVACSGNDLSGNGVAPHSGCDDACGI